MANDYIKLWVKDYRALLEPFSEAERGRILWAMMDYKESGTEPSFLGNERFVWAAIKATLHFAQNADAGTEESYLRNLPLLKLLAKENIEADDWSVLLAATPNNEDKLLWCLGYTGTLCALDATDFDDWVVYCSTVVLSALEACGVEAPDERKNLLSIGLAARTFNFSGNPVTKNLKCAETIQGAASYNCTEDADIFSMWYLLQVLTEYLRLDFNGNLRELIDAMKTMNKIRDRYRQIADRLPKMDAC